MTLTSPKPAGTPANPAEPVLLTEAEVDQVAGGMLPNFMLDAVEKALPKAPLRVIYIPPMVIR
jgi:hypothetical protein